MSQFLTCPIVWVSVWVASVAGCSASIYHRTTTPGMNSASAVVCHVKDTANIEWNYSNLWKCKPKRKGWLVSAKRVAACPIWHNWTFQSDGIQLLFILSNRLHRYLHQIQDSILFKRPSFLERARQNFPLSWILSSSLLWWKELTCTISLKLW